MKCVRKTRLTHHALTRNGEARDLTSTIAR